MYRILLFLSLMWPDFLQTWVSESTLIFMTDLIFQNFQIKALIC